ncbi:RNase_H superfamily protein [Clostridium cavendishii DSM 21758]|uniref:RNase_H superfamily protein n=1 Tax=Clostridium cavendishii DSM 21758 TaxID=1121302 RepID=A0A1M6FGD6_9CLOT|nr:ribonuclease H-like domain-containing protein [Clostridium cavendishii]SHI96798.1 RNase_H superfamily protein [Clostridium cavendishii DSM 21758]
MIIREREVFVDSITEELVLNFEGVKDCYKQAVFFDLEHYVYKKPKCVGVFGACYYDNETSKLMVTQYMIENKGEVIDILHLAKRYFNRLTEELNKKYIVTFSGNNDFTVINYLFEKYGINYDFNQHFTSIDIQKIYEQTFKQGVGLKVLEKKFGIEREGELISGSNLAKTFHKVLKDREYFERMPKDKIEKILIYNEQDVVNLFHIYVHWQNLVNKVAEEAKLNEIVDEELEEKADVSCMA